MRRVRLGLKEERERGASSGGRGELAGERVRAAGTCGGSERADHLGHDGEELEDLEEEEEGGGRYSMGYVILFGFIYLWTVGRIPCRGAVTQAQLATHCSANVPSNDFQCARLQRIKNIVFL